MATEAAGLECKESTGRNRKQKEKNTLDSYRPSHGRHSSLSSGKFRLENVEDADISFKANAGIDFSGDEALHA